MKNLFSLIIICICSVTLLGQTGTLKGTIIDSEDKQVSVNTINADGLVSLNISQETSNSEAAGQGELALAPVIVSRSITTSVLAENGQTVVLGGLIQDTLSTNDNKVPFLGSIPIIGRLFQSEGESTGRTELMVMITPRIIKETSELDAFGQKLTELYSFPVLP